MIVIGTVLTQTLGMDTIPRTVHEILQTIEIEFIQLVEIETIRIIDHKLVQQWTIIEKT